MNPKLYAKLQARWEIGVYVGNSDLNDSYLIYDPELRKTVASSIFEQGAFTHEERWDADAMGELEHYH